MDDKTAITELQRYIDWPPLGVQSHAVRAIELAAWYEAREGFVRALIGAVEDAGVFRDEAQDEWRLLVLWEQDNKKP